MTSLLKTLRLELQKTVLLETKYKQLYKVFKGYNLYIKACTEYFKGYNVINFTNSKLNTICVILQSSFF